MIYPAERVIVVRRYVIRSFAIYAVYVADSYSR